MGGAGGGAGGGGVVRRTLSGEQLSQELMSRHVYSWSPLAEQRARERENNKPVMVCSHQCVVCVCVCVSFRSSIRPFIRPCLPLSFLPPPSLVPSLPPFIPPSVPLSLTRSIACSLLHLSDAQPGSCGDRTQSTGADTASDRAVAPLRDGQGREGVLCAEGLGVVLHGSVSNEDARGASCSP